MTSLALRSVVHYWRTNLATALGIAAAVAVLAGAYTVGDSVRSSLRSLVEQRLGNTDYVVASTGFFSEKLLPGSPLIALEAVVTHDDSGRRASRVAVYGVDERFFQFHQKGVIAPDRHDVLLSPALVAELVAQPGDSILLRVPKSSAIPTESLHGSKDDPGRTLRLRTRETIARAAMGEFALRPQQAPVRAAFVSLARLQRDLELDGRVNAVLVRGESPEERVKQSFTLADLGIRVRNGMVEHESMMLSDDLVDTIRKIDPNARPVFTYLANSMRIRDREVPYSLVAATERLELLSDKDVVLNDWAARDLSAKRGDQIAFEYYLWDPSGRLITQSASFRVVAIVPVNPEDAKLAPEYPGISDASSISDWDPPFPMNLGRITQRDEDYWDKFRATPKAYIRLAAGQSLWRSRFGQVTSMAVSPAFSETKLRSAIDPTAAGLTIQNARAESLQASLGATDFGEYFFYFSFFLIVSALMLAGLFFRLGIEQRIGQITTLRALGYSVGQIRRIHLTEGLLIGAAGAVLGVLGALAYSGLILTGLRTWWIDAVGTRDIALHISPAAILLAIAGGIGMAPVAIFGTLRTLGRRKPREAKAVKKSRSNLLATMFALIGLSLLAVGGPAGFFGAGAMLLTAALIFFWGTLRRRTGQAATVRQLGIGYAAHRPGRSVLCVALIASATFLIVAIDAFRRSGHGSEPGYRYFAESAIPVYHDPNASDGREALNLPAELQAKWLAFRLRPGEDASCLNLYQPQNPRVLGAPSSWINPEWKLDATENDGTIPAVVDANSLMYVLHRKVGDVMEVGGKRLRFVTALNDSLFQGELIISEPNFRKAFPEEQGYRVFLIDAPAGSDAPIENALSDYGVDVTTTAERRAAFHRVENTYLSTFQALGGLGLVLGTIGLATVLLRNVLERRRELGLLRAVGYDRGDLASMILAENVLLLATGLFIGAICALIAVGPTAWQRGGSIPFVSLAVLLATVAVTGLVSSWIAVRVAVRAPMLDALRSE